MKTTSKMKSSKKGFAMRFIAAFLAINILSQIIFPTVALALTSGPAQPETQGFEPVTTNQMVDLFSGDFTYNIPLFNLPGKNGGYPFNMAYHSGIGMDDEASWVGLGWSLTPGAINRDIRGVADDSKGDMIKETFDMKANTTIGASVGATFELFGAKWKNLGWDVGVNFKMYHNSYKGLGGGLGFNTGFTFGSGSNKLKTTLSTGLDTQGGADIGANVSLNTEKENKRIRYSLGATLSSGSGLAMNYGITGSKNKYRTGLFIRNSKVAGKKSTLAKFGGSAGLTFTSNSYSPAIDYQTSSYNLTGSFAVGASAIGAFGGGDISVFWSEEGIAKKRERLENKSYGYLHLTDATDADLIDFQREKDGPASEEWTNMPSAQLTYDVYSVSGQGISAMYRPFRSDYGHVHDQSKESLGRGGALGGEIGVGTDIYWGLNGSYNWSVQKSGDWESNLSNGMHNVMSFNDRGEFERTEKDYERVYFKNHGESTFMTKDEWDGIHGDDAVLVPIDHNYADNTLQYRQGDVALNAPSDRYNKDAHRVKRNLNIQTLTNKDLNGATGEYGIKYYGSTTDYSLTNLIQSLGRTGTKGAPGPEGVSPLNCAISNHVGAITTTNADGLRYNYALPAYNLSKREYLYSIKAENENICARQVPVPVNICTDGKYKTDDLKYTDQFFKRTETPAGAHSYLLTSILGTDYVDVTGDGPSDDDFGYWVKFNYVKTTTTENYKWRAPFNGAQAGHGSALTNADDKASFQYGEKEIWYLATVESSTHVAVFKISPREDAKGVSTEFQNIGDAKGTASLYKLDKIDLYTKEEFNKTSPNVPVPIQSVHFVYDYSLCPDVPNNSGNSAYADWNGDGNVQDDNAYDVNYKQGKLTLKKLYFTYQNNSRGRLSPYEFNYGNPDDLNLNPPYSQENYDRWGNFKKYDPLKTGCDIDNQPYVDQVGSGAKANADAWSSAWHMREIKLPSGGTISVDYESDDYGFVQHKEATQMFQIEKLGWADLDDKEKNRLFSNNGDTPGEVWDNTPQKDWKEGTEGYNIETRRIYFKLEKPVPNSQFSSEENRKKYLVEKYLKGLKPETSSPEYQLYFKVKMNIRDGIYEYISGYADLDMTDGYYDFGPADGNDNFNNAYVTVKSVKVDFWTGSPKYYHPFSFAGWQYMKAVKPEIISATPFNPGDVTTAKTDMEKVLRAKSFASSFSQYAIMFKGFTTRCFDKNYCSSIELANSYIKLNSPDRTKFGGGSRVKKIQIKDSWNDIDPNKINPLTNTPEAITYGQVYDYTTTDRSGEKISSGVASYEPIIGGDENALRYAKAFKKNRLFNVDELSFSEFPMMEQYYPGASVGYSKVTVMSLASDNAAKNINSSGQAINAEIAARAKSGLVVNEFYTYKEFPVIVEETPIWNEPDKFIFPIPLVGMIYNKDLTSSQGYCIRLNDMNGKPKKVTTYSQKATGKINDNKIVSEVSYEYRTKKSVYQGRDILILDNELDGSEVLVDGSLTAPDAQGKMQVKRASDKYMLGVEYDYFSDMRRQFSEQGQAGMDFNSGGVFFFLPWLSLWPSFSYSSNDFRAVTVNKVIHQTGILKKTVATDGQSTVSTETKLYDLETGAPLLTTVNNNYDSPVYKYEVPAHWSYPRTGAAYKNSGLVFAKTISDVDASTKTFTINDAELYALVTTGDELLASKSGAAPTKVTVTDKDGTSTFTLNGLSANDTYTFKLLRSGRRNLLSTNVGSIVALDDPTAGILKVSSYKVVLHEMEAFINSLITGGTIALQGDPWYGVPYYEKTFTSDQLRSRGFPGLAGAFNSIILARNGYSQISMGATKDNVTQFCGLVTNQNMNLKSIKLNILPDQTVEFVTTTINPPQVGTTNASLVSGGRCYTELVDDYFIKNVLQASSIGLNDYWVYSDDVTPNYNPYKTGNSGVWRPIKNYYYKDERYSAQEKSTNPSKELALNADGVFKGNPTSTDFDKAFYLFNWKNPSLSNSHWVPNQSITAYSRDGFELENKDILGIFSSAKYGYNNALVTMVAANANKDQLYFESFEDLSYSQVDVSSGVTIGTAHTGNRFAIPAKKNANTQSFTLTNLPLLQSGVTYVFNAWVNADFDLSTWENKLKITLSKNGTELSSLQVNPKGNIIEGWQKVEGQFTLSSTLIASDQINLNLNDLDADNYVVFSIDDIRIFPKDAAVTSYVYNPSTFRLMATLDNNHYATFYYYDDQGNLHLTKRETANGVFTVSENRGHIIER